MSRGAVATTAAAVAVVVGVAVAVVGAFPPATAGLFSVTGVGLGMAAFGLFRSRGSAGALVVGLALAAGLGRGALAVLPSPLSDHLDQGRLVATGTVREAAPSGWVIEVDRIVSGDKDVPTSGAVLVTGQRLPGLEVGNRVEFEVTSLRGPGRRAGPRSLETLERDGVVAIGTATRVDVTDPGGPSPQRTIATVRAHLSSAMATALTPPISDALLGIVFGIHRSLPSDVSAPLQDTGLYHIVVVSGLKVVIILALIRAVSRTREWSHRRLGVTAGLVIGVYVLLAGAGPAPVRSGLMAGAAMILNRDGRRVESFALLAVVAAGMVLMSPLIVLDAGFHLSFLGTAGILLLADRIGHRLPGPRLLAEPFAVTVAAQIATLPVMASTFGVISLVGPIANALVLPFLGPLMLLGLAGTVLTLIAPAVGGLLLGVAGYAVLAIMVLARALAAVPGAAIHLGQWPVGWTICFAAAVGIGLAAWAYRRQRGDSQHARAAASRSKAWTVAAVMGLTIVPAVSAGVWLATSGQAARVTVLDVGAAPAVLVTTPGGSHALVDGGSNPTALTTALGRVLLPTTRRIDLVVMTGSDRGLSAGLAGLAGHYDVGAIALCDAPTAGAARVLDQVSGGQAAQAVTGGSPWSWGRLTWQCLPAAPPTGGKPSRFGLSLCADRRCALLLGNLSTADQGVLASEQVDTLRAQLLITPPGGALDPALLRTVRPAYLAAPSAVTGRVTAPAGVSVARTGIDGDLVYLAGGSGFEPG